MFNIIDGTKKRTPITENNLPRFLRL